MCSALQKPSAKTSQISSKPTARRRYHLHASRITSRHIQQLLPRVLEEIGQLYGERGDLILAAWPDVVGPDLAPMTQAISFIDGILSVKVKNSTLYSLLSRYDKPRLIKNLRDKFPKAVIKTIYFRLG